MVLNLDGDRNSRLMVQIQPPAEIVPRQCDDIDVAEIKKLQVRAAACARCRNQGPPQWLSASNALSGNPSRSFVQRRSTYLPRLVFCIDSIDRINVPGRPAVGVKRLFEKGVGDGLGQFGADHASAHGDDLSVVG